MTTKAHPTCRPPRGACGYALGGITGTSAIKLGTNGRWRSDDGKPGLAFIGSLDGSNIVWVSSCKCVDATCPRWKALERAREVIGLESVIVQECVIYARGADHR